MRTIDRYLLIKTNANATLMAMEMSIEITLLHSIKISITRQTMLIIKSLLRLIPFVIETHKTPIQCRKNLSIIISTTTTLTNNRTSMPNCNHHQVDQARFLRI